MNEPKKIDEYKLKKIRTFIINYVMRNPDVMFNVPDMPNGEPDLIDIIVGLYEYLHVIVTGEEYDYMWHFANKIGSWCDTHLFDKYIESEYQNMKLIVDKYIESEDKNMELIDTIGDMISTDYKKRFKAEYQQIKIRYNKLYKLLEDNKNNKLSFELNCPLELLEQQYLAMYRYLSLLEQRAIIENIKLN